MRLDMLITIITTPRWERHIDVAVLASCLASSPHVMPPSTQHSFDILMGPFSIMRATGLLDAAMLSDAEYIISFLFSKLLRAAIC